MFKRLAVLGAAVATLALVPSAHADTKVEVDAAVEVEESSTSGLVDLLRLLGFTVEELKVDADLDV
jgi:hypothetical protein